MIEIIQLKIMQCIAEEAKTRCKYKVHFKNFRSFTGSIFDVWIKSKFHIEKFDILITSIIWMDTFWFKDFFRLVCLCLLIIFKLSSFSSYHGRNKDLNFQLPDEVRSSSRKDFWSPGFCVISNLLSLLSIYEHYLLPLLSVLLSISISKH